MTEEPEDHPRSAELEEEIVEIEVGDVLDLHSFPPSEVKELVADYLELARARGFSEVRIIHGKGRGVLKRTVRVILDRSPEVEGYSEAPLGAGGWGATLVRLRPPAG